SFNVFVRLELHGRCLCRVWLFWKIELLRLKWLACFRRTGCRSLSCCRRRSSLACLARSCYLSALCRLAGLHLRSFHWGLAFLALLTLVSFHRELTLLALLTLRSPHRGLALLALIGSH